MRADAEKHIRNEHKATKKKLKNVMKDTYKQVDTLMEAAFGKTEEMVDKWEFKQDEAEAEDAAEEERVKNLVDKWEAKIAAFQANQVKDMGQGIRDSKSAQLQEEAEFRAQDNQFKSGQRSVQKLQHSSEDALLNVKEDVTSQEQTYFTGLNVSVGKSSQQAKETTKQVSSQRKIHFRSEHMSTVC